MLEFTMKMKIFLKYGDNMLKNEIVYSVYILEDLATISEKLSNLKMT